MSNNIFKFKRAKKTIGDFDADDTQEWCLLIKEYEFETRFVHIRKGWCIQEQPEIQADEDNGIEYQPAKKKIMAYNISRGFIKDGNFVLEGQTSIKNDSEDVLRERFLNTLTGYVEEGWGKDWNNYNGDIPIEPKYHTFQANQLGSAMSTMKMMNQMAANIIPSGSRNVVNVNLNQQNP